MVTPISSCLSIAPTSSSTATSGTATGGCTKYTVPKTNEQFWREKVARNIACDELNAQLLDTLA